MRSRHAPLAARLAVLALLAAAGARLDAQVDGHPGAGRRLPAGPGREATAAVPGSAEEAFTSTHSAEGNGGFIDKGRIAEETLGRIESLRAAGNPHIRRGLKIEAIVDERRSSRWTRTSCGPRPSARSRSGSASPAPSWRRSRGNREAEVAHGHHLGPDDRSPSAGTPQETGEVSASGSGHRGSDRGDRPHFPGAVDPGS